MSEKVAILDCGGQYTKVIDRKVREMGVNSDIFPINVDSAKLAGYKGIILSGGPSSVWAENSPRFDDEMLSLGIPVLGICYGMQLINKRFGGVVRPKDISEYGVTEIKTSPCALFDGLDAVQSVLMSHGDSVIRVADGFSVCAETDNGVVAAICDESRKIYGVQFHPEVDLTENGLAMMKNFLRGICACRETYALGDRIQTSIDMIRRKVGDGNVIVLVSGGVDSAVTAALCLRALDPAHVYGIHVDHGLMRKNESDVICENLKKLGFVNLRRINAEERFFNSPVVTSDGKAHILSRECDPEIKRQIIGTAFIDVLKTACDELKLDFDRTYIAQGTLRPDLIESGNPDVSGFAHKIKTHHNDVDIIRRAREKGMIVETNWDWHKDEVRRIAVMLGLGEEVAMRQPFPGPGLGVRILCADSASAATDDESSRFAAYIAKTPGLSGAIAPINSVGVQGDCRSYRKMAVISGYGDIDAALKIASDMPNTLNFINRVTVPLDGASAGEMSVTPTHICHETAELLRELDDIAVKALKTPKIAQCFAVLLPVCRGNDGKRSVVFRAVVTNDFMTARAAVPGRDIDTAKLTAAAKEIRARFGDKIDLILYDITGKPPATVEWE